MKKIVLSLILLGIVLVSYGQSCTQLLKIAEDNYENGKLLSIVKPANSEALNFMQCLEVKVADGGFTKEEEIRARKLLTKVYIFTDNEALAEIALIGLLKSDPEHLLDPQVDPAELFYLMEQFRTEPIFRVSVRAGLNFCNPNIITEFSTVGSTEVPKLYNSESSLGITPGNWVQILAEREIYKGLEVTLGTQLRTSKYNVEFQINDPNLRVTATNQQTYIRVPLGIRYTLWSFRRDKNLLPYVFAGASYDKLLKAEYVGARQGGTAFTIPTAVSDAGNNDLMATGLVNNSTMSLYAGLGVKYRVKTHFVTLDGRFDSSTSNYINATGRFDNKSLAFDAAFIEDNLSLNMVSIALGFTYSVHYPRKLKQYQ